MFYLIADEEDLVKEFFGASRDEVFVIDEVDDSEIDFNGMLNFGGTLDKIIETENGFSTSSDKEIDWRTHILAKFFSRLIEDTIDQSDKSENENDDEEDIIDMNTVMHYVKTLGQMLSVKSS